MCDATAIAIAGVVASAAGTAATMQQNANNTQAAQQASDDQAHASEAARVAAQAQQDAMSKTAWDNWQQQLTASSADNVNKTITGASTNMLDTTNNIENQVGVGQNSMPTGADANASPEEKADMARAASVYADRAKSKIAAMSTLAGYNAVAPTTAIQNDQFNSNLGLFNDTRSSALKTGLIAGNVPGSPVYGTNQGIAGAETSLGNAALGFGLKKYGANTDIWGNPIPASGASAANIAAAPPSSAYYNSAGPIAGANNYT